MDFRERFDLGRGYWLNLCSGAALLDDLTLLQTFVDRGADATEVDDYAFNCLFVFMSRTKLPSTAQEYKALRRLLEIFKDIHALDAMGSDIFAYVNEVQDWPETYTDPLSHIVDCGSYKQDLWYCALARSNLHDRHTVQPCNRLARYTEFNPAIVWHGIRSPIHRSTTWHYAILTSGTHGTKRDSKGRFSQCCTSTLCLKKSNVFRKKWRPRGDGRASQLMVLNRLTKACNGILSYLHKTVAYHSTIVRLRPK
jgi:hypothetical protein